MYAPVRAASERPRKLLRFIQSSAGLPVHIFVLEPVNNEFNISERPHSLPKGARPPYPWLLFRCQPALPNMQPSAGQGRTF